MQKINYQLKLDELLNSIKASGKHPKLLLHSCCAPCSSYVISYLMEYFDITVFYYNPNIYPESEFEHRKSEQQRLINEINKAGGVSYTINDTEIKKYFADNIKLIIPDYDHAEFLEAAKGLENEREGGLRCTECFRLRLKKTSDFALSNGFDYFGTTLSVSPHKNAVLLNEIGCGLENGPAYLISDFKKKEGYKISISLSERFGLYRQNYCGCEFS